MIKITGCNEIPKLVTNIIYSYLHQLRFCLNIIKLLLSMFYFLRNGTDHFLARFKIVTMEIGFGKTRGFLTREFEFKFRLTRRVRVKQNLSKNSELQVTFIFSLDNNSSIHQRIFNDFSEKQALSQPRKKFFPNLLTSICYF